jgi:hypothetical protein
MGDSHEVWGALDVEKANSISGTARVIFEIPGLDLVCPWRTVTYEAGQHDDMMKCVQESKGE